MDVSMLPEKNMFLKQINNFEEKYSIYLKEFIFVIKSYILNKINIDSLF